MTNSFVIDTATTESGSYPAFKTSVLMLTDGDSIIETEAFVGVIGVPL